MRSTFYLTASAFAALASAQLSSKCNPMVNETGSCPDNPAISASFEVNFKDGKEASLKGMDVENWSVENYAPKFTAEGVELTVGNKNDVPVLRTQGYFLFGKAEIRMKAAPGAGIVSSVVLASADLDEVDWEWLGGFPDKVQTNYFGKGNATTFDRVTEVPVQNQEFHTYALDWTKEKLDWIIDDKVVRTLKYEEALGGKNYPQTPCTLGFGPWAAGDSENEGTSQWAGGKIDWSKGPFTQTIEWIKITNYSPGTAYKWKDQSGSWESIEVIGAGNEQGAPVNTEVATPAANSTAATEGIGSHPRTTSAAEGDQPTESPKEGEQPAETNNPGYGEKPSETAPGYGEKPSETPNPSESTSCTDSEKPSATHVAPVGGTAPPAPEEPCDCETETTTMTGYPPSPPPSGTPPPPPQTESPPPPPESTEVSPPPPQTESPPPPQTESPLPPQTESPPPPQTESPPPPQTESPPPPQTESPPPPQTESPPPPQTESPPPPQTESPPPPQTESPPPPQTEAPPPPPGSTSCTTSTSLTITVPNPPETTEVSPFPPVETSQTTLDTTATPPPYPTIKTDSNTYPVPSAPTGAVPTGGNTTSPPIQEFPGTATHNTAGALLGLVGAALLMAF